jgi:hypothetical protein
MIAEEAPGQTRIRQKHFNQMKEGYEPHQE